MSKRKLNTKILFPSLETMAKYDAEPSWSVYGDPSPDGRLSGMFMTDVDGNHSFESMLSMSVNAKVIIWRSGKVHA